jgi:hypothetical protein
MFFIVNWVLSGFMIAFCSWLAGKKPVLAGFLLALPLASLLSILFSYFEFRDMARINQFAVSILMAVPLSLTFFIPFLLNRWFKMNFFWTFFLGIGCLVISYFLHQLFMKKSGF